MKKKTDKKNESNKKKDSYEELEEGELPEYITVTDELDLHGFFPEQVPEILDEFIRNALELGLFHLRIVHGKGKSKMKWAVHQVLKQHTNVITFGDARPELGGWGATIIELGDE